jgi:cytoskeletal protein RodZ
MTIEGLGKKFQDARIARGLTLDEAARLTKIRPSRLAEIEADDFSQFPSLAYAKGFLLIYGKFLDVDVSPYLDVFETSREVTVDGYSYLQDQPAPKARRVRPTHAPTVRRQRMSSGGDRRSPIPVLIGVGVIILGFVLMRLIMNIQRISPHQMVGVPQPTATQSGPPQQAPPAQAQVPPQQNVKPQAPATAAPVAPSRAPSPPPAAVVEAPKKSAPPVATAPPSIAPPDAFVPAFANANPAAKASVAPAPAATPVAFANASATAKASPEVRRAEPVKPEDLAKAGATQVTQTTQRTTTEAQGPNQVAIKPLKKTYIKVVVDNGSVQPAFERWISPSDGTVEFKGQKIAVRVLDRDAIQIKKNGKPVAGGDEDVTVE